MDMLLATSQREFDDLKEHFTFKAAKKVYHGITCPEWDILPLLEQI